MSLRPTGDLPDSLYTAPKPGRKPGLLLRPRHGIPPPQAVGNAVPLMAGSGSDTRLRLLLAFIGHLTARARAHSVAVAVNARRRGYAAALSPPPAPPHTPGHWAGLLPALACWGVPPPAGGGRGAPVRAPFGRARPTRPLRPAGRTPARPGRRRAAARPVHPLRGWPG